MPSAKPLIAVGAIIVRDRELLMVRRANDPGKGLWSIPGGRLEANEYLTEAVRREVKEETGLEVTVHHLVGILEVLGDPHYVIHDYLAELIGDDTPTPSGDAAEARWVPFDEVETLKCTPRFVETLTAWGVLTSE